MTIQNARKSSLWVSLAAFCLTAATAVSAERTLSADGPTLTFDVAADAVYTNTTAPNSAMFLR